MKIVIGMKTLLNLQRRIVKKEVQKKLDLWVQEEAIKRGMHRSKAQRTTDGN